MTHAGPPFFIVGSARSGTTLLRLTLNAHPLVAVPPESRFVTDLWTGDEEVEVSSILRQLDAHGRFQAWDLPVGAVARELGTSERAPYASVIRAAFEAYAHVNGKVRWGDKTPRYIEKLPLLARLFPDARFIHLIRDGRNVALSYADVPFGPKTVAKAAALWADRVTAGIRDGRALGGGRYLEMRYEAMVEDPGGEVKALCEFLDLEFDAGMLDHTERARSGALARAARFNPHVLEPSTATFRNWEQMMPPAQVELFEAVAGPVLSRLGYPRRHPHPGRAARFKAALGRAGLPLGRLQKTR